MAVSTDLLEVIGNDAADLPGFCEQIYWEWEDKVAAVRLRGLGWDVKRWCDGERDSFGPLTRYCVAELNGVTHHLIYG